MVERLKGIGLFENLYFTRRRENEIEDKNDKKYAFFSKSVKISFLKKIYYRVEFAGTGVSVSHKIDLTAYGLHRDHPIELKLRRSTVDLKL